MSGQSCHCLYTTLSPCQQVSLEPNHPKWVSALHKSYMYSCHGAPCLLGDGKLLKAGTLVISTFLFPECLAQWTFLCVEVKQHTLIRRGLEKLRASCLPDRCAYLHICPNAQQSVIKGRPQGRFNSFSITHDLSTFLHHSHLVHRNFGGFILADGIYYKG